MAAPQIIVQIVFFFVTSVLLQIRRNRKFNGIRNNVKLNAYGKSRTNKDNSFYQKIVHLRNIANK